MEAGLKSQGFWIGFIGRQWLLVASAAGFLLSVVSARKFPVYSIKEFQILAVLFSLFVTVKGLEKSGLLAGLSRRIEMGKALPVKMVVATFFVSMVVTNDVALITLVPLTMALNIRRKDLVVIFEALAANAGSAFTPFGNPQNLFIYWFYDLPLLRFIQTMAPFSLVFLFLLILGSSFIKTEAGLQATAPTILVGRMALFHVLLLVLIILTVLHVLPFATVFLVVLSVMWFDRTALRVDYSLVLSFFFFFGIADNMKAILAAEIAHSKHVFILSALASQLMSNVPVALVFAKFTHNWAALLWGTNAGGFGSLLGSLANLIAYKIYITQGKDIHPADFTLKFLLFGYAAFIVSAALFFGYSELSIDQMVF